MNMIRSMSKILRGECTYRLPERKEDNQLDREDFQERAVLLDIILDLNVELDQAVHRNTDTNGLNDDNPNIRKSRTERFFTISPGSLSGDRDNGHQHAHQTVLKDTNPNNLEADPVVSIICPA